MIKRMTLSLLLVLTVLLSPATGQARFYDPSNGRFNQMDTFAGNNDDPQSLHKYLYCHAESYPGYRPDLPPNYHTP